MKMKIVGIIVCMLLIATVLPVTGLTEDNENRAVHTARNDVCDIIPVGYYENDDILDQQQNIDCGYGWQVLHNVWEAQGFIPSLPILTRVWLYVFELGSPTVTELIVTIRDNLTGDDLTEALTYGPTGSQWVEFDFLNIKVTPGDVYYIVCKAPAEGNDYDNCYCWFFGIDNPYENGEAWYSQDYGATWNIREYLPDYPENDFCFKTYGLEQYPPDIPDIDGPANGKAGTEYDYNFTAIDPEEDNVSYFVDWGDDTTTEWTDFVASGTEITLTHTWAEKDTYTIKAKAKDTNGAESDWAELEVSMPISQQLQNWWFLQFLQNHPNLFPILQKLLRQLVL